MSKRGTIYLLHFDRPVPRGSPSRHYIGYTTDLDARLADHAAGCGARLLRLCRDEGISWQCVRTWPLATRRQERALKDRCQHARLCPLCRAAALARHAAEERRRRAKMAAAKKA
jgi:predicted GIY-YIG superfamily endonuclease